MIEKECEICNEKFYVKLYRRYTARFCSKLCLSKWNSINQMGENNPRWSRIKKICEMCKKVFVIRRYRRDIARFCNHKCYSKWLSINTRGENSPSWRGKIIKHCLNCNKIIKTYQCLKNRKKFCSVKCRQLYYVGEHCSGYLGGKKENRKILDSYKWKKWKIRIYERDNYKCQICGENGKSPHHIYPMRTFPEMIYDEDNVILLCMTCHNKYEGIEYIGLFDIIRSYNDTN